MVLTPVELRHYLLPTALAASLLRFLAALACPLLMAPTVAFISLNFTGPTTFTSQSGVRREIARYARPMAATAAAGVMALVGKPAACCGESG